VELCMNAVRLQALHIISNILKFYILATVMARPFFILPQAGRY
jgi:hypothetical protein